MKKVLVMNFVMNFGMADHDRADREHQCAKASEVPLAQAACGYALANKGTFE
jgi:hypothetical protein